VTLRVQECGWHNVDLRNVVVTSPSGELSGTRHFRTLRAEQRYWLILFVWQAFWEDQSKTNRDGRTNCDSHCFTSRASRMGGVAGTYWRCVRQACLVHDSSVGLDGPGIESWLGARFSVPVQTGPGAHPASCTMGTGSFAGVKRPGRGVGHPPPSSAEVKERVDLYLYSPWGPSRPVLRPTLRFVYCYV
jgi:hypothetical protein